MVGGAINHSRSCKDSRLYNVPEETNNNNGTVKWLSCSDTMTRPKLGPVALASRMFSKTSISQCRSSVRANAAAGGQGVHARYIYFQPDCGVEPQEATCVNVEKGFDPVIAIDKWIRPLMEAPRRAVAQMIRAAEKRLGQLRGLYL